METFPSIPLTADSQDRWIMIVVVGLLQGGRQAQFLPCPKRGLHWFSPLSLKEALWDVGYCIVQKVWCTWHTFWNWTWIQYQILCNSFWNTMVGKIVHFNEMVDFFRGNTSPFIFAQLGDPTTSFMESGSNSSSDFSWAFLESEPKRNETGHGKNQ